MEWISVKDGEPERGKYLVAGTEYGIQIGWRDTRYKNYWYGNDEQEIVVTHWMPLPESPKETL